MATSAFKILCFHIETLNWHVEYLFGWKLCDDKRVGILESMKFTWTWRFKSAHKQLTKSQFQRNYPIQTLFSCYFRLLRQLNHWALNSFEEKIFSRFPLLSNEIRARKARRFKSDATFLHMNINKTKVLRLIVVADGRILYQPKKQEEKQYQYKLKHNG